MRKNAITGSTLKIIAVIAMLMDHTAWCIIDPLLYQNKVSFKNLFSPLWQVSLSPVLCVVSPLFHIIGRITFPIMLFLLVEGLKYTRNKLKYVRNMLIFSIISEIPFNLAFGKKVFESGSFFPYLEGQNVFVTLTFCLITLIIVENILNLKDLSLFRKILSVLGAPAFFMCVSWYLIKRSFASFGYTTNYYITFAVFILFFCAYIILTKKIDKEKRDKINLSLFVITFFAMVTYFLDSDYRFMGIITVSIMYFLKENKNRSFSCACAYLTFNTYAEFGSFLAVPLIMNYNGKRGSGLKYLFYIIYPGHLLILYLIRYLLKL